MTNQGEDKAHPDAMLQRLLATVDDRMIFPDAPYKGADGGPDTEAIENSRDSCRSAMRALYAQGMFAWQSCMRPEASGQIDKPKTIGVELNRKYSVLQGDSLASFRDAIQQVAETADAEDRDFLYFMLGTLYGGRMSRATKPAQPVEPSLIGRLRGLWYDRMRAGSTRADDD